MHEDMYPCGKAGCSLCFSLINVDLAYTYLTTNKALKAFTVLHIIYLEDFSVIHSL